MTDDPADRLERIKSLLHEALSAPSGDRLALVRARSGGDAVVFAEVVSLLQAEAGSDEFFDRLSGTIRPTAKKRAEGREGTRVGPYRLEAPVGQGGSGVVYRGVSDSGVEVAVKVFDPAVWSETALARFEVEQRVLAGLSHPGIVGLIDSGREPGGTPWYSMPLIEGEAIDEWVDARRATVADRLKLMTTVCDTVAHAHEAGVLHRDLKPSNILVDEHGRPILLDFGVAKLLDGRTEADPSALTLAGRSFTPHYASPEQLLGESVGPWTDTFSLGAILYRLLVGRPPRVRLDPTPAADPIKLLPDAPEGRAALAAARSVSVEVFERALTGAVAALLRRACHGDAAERYQTCSDVASAISRCLASG